MGEIREKRIRHGNIDIWLDVHQWDVVDDLDIYKLKCTADVRSIWAVKFSSFN